MNTPNDIQNKRFSTSVMGYSKVDVEDFLEEVSKEVEALILKISEKDQQIQLLNNEIDKFKRMESTIHEAMLLAQHTSDNLLAQNREKADFILSKAQAEAYGIINEAREELSEIQKQKEAARADVRAFKLKFRLLIENQLKLFEEQTDID